MSLMTKAGVKRVRLVECAPIPWTTPFEEYFLEANWNTGILSAPPQSWNSRTPTI